VRSRAIGGLAAALSLVGCSLALGLEEAEEITGSGGGCASASECDDANPCTEDSCDGGDCLHAPLDGDLPDDAQTIGDCRRAICAEGSISEATDAGDVPVDGKACTEDVCNGNQPQNPPKAGGSPCTENDGQVCDGNGLCVECFTNAECTLPETCGGGGPPGQCGCTPTITCGTLGLTCGGGGTNDCDMAIQCSNGIKDGDETDIDCGGPQPTMGGTCAILCSSGKSCVNNTDCVSNSCTGGVCD